MAGLKVKIGADASQFERTMRGVKKDIGGVKKAIIGIAAAAGGLYAVNKAFDGMRAAARGAFAFIRSSSEEASGIESLTMQFTTLLGGATEAKERMKEITQFAATTPFEIKELAQTSKLLETLGGNLLSTGEGLRMVGDAAAISGQPIGEVGLHIGRLFNAITSGTSAGESVARLQELGLISGDVKRGFEDLAFMQKKGKAPILEQAQALQTLQSILVKTSGAMELLSLTTEGKLSNMKDNISQLKVAFGTGFNDGLKVALDATNKFLPELQEQMTVAGKMIGGIIRNVVEGDFQVFSTIGALIGDLIIGGMKIALSAAGSTISSTIVRNARHLSPTSSFGGKGDEWLQQQADLIEQGGQAERAAMRGDVAKKFRDSMQQIQSQTMREEGMNGTMWRPAKPGESTPFTNANNERVVQVLESIDKKLDPGFAN